MRLRKLKNLDISYRRQADIWRVLQADDTNLMPKELEVRRILKDHREAHPISGTHTLTDRQYMTAFNDLMRLNIKTLRML